MSLEGRDLSDTQILDATKIENDPQGSRLAIELPSKRMLYSDYGAPEELKKRLIPWCEGVRSAVDADAQEERSRKLRDALDTGSLNEAHDVVQDMRAAQKTQRPPSAYEYAEAQVAHYRDEDARLSKEQTRIAYEIERVRRELVRWETIRMSFEAEA